MTDCQFANYLADVAGYIKLFSVVGLSFGGLGVFWSFFWSFCPESDSHKWLPIISIVSIIVFVLLITFIPDPKIIIFGCDKIEHLF